MNMTWVYRTFLWKLKLATETYHNYGSEHSLHKTLNFYIFPYVLRSLLPHMVSTRTECSPHIFKNYSINLKLNSE